MCISLKKKKKSKEALAALNLTYIGPGGNTNLFFYLELDEFIYGIASSDMGRVRQLFNFVFHLYYMKIISFHFLYFK